jgi:hypothetical protein
VSSGIPPTCRVEVLTKTEAKPVLCVKNSNKSTLPILRNRNLRRRRMKIMMGSKIKLSVAQVR